MSTFARSGSDIAIPLAIVSDPQTCAAIRIADDLKLGLGEYFADKGQGFPWLQQVLGIKNPNLTSIKALIRKAVLQTPGIVRVVDVSTSFNPTTRVFAYAFAAVDNTGAIINGGSTPFVVGGGQ